MSTYEIDYENMGAYLRHCEAEGIERQPPEQWGAWVESIRFRDTVKDWVRFGQRIGWLGLPFWLAFTPSVIGLQIAAQIWVWMTDDPSVFP